MEGRAEGDILAVDLAADAGVADARVDMVGEVEHGGSLGKLQQVALRGEGIDLVLVEVELELVHHLQVVACLQGGADRGEPLLHAAAVGLHALVAPVGGEAVLGHLVHALGADLHLHPLLLRTEHGDVETLVAIGLRHADPVAQALRVGLVHVGDDGVGLPTLHLLLLQRGVEDDADGKEVVDAIDTTLLLLHLLPNGVDRLGAALDMKFESGLGEVLAHRTDEALDVGVSGALRGVEFLLDQIVGVVLEILQREVLQLALELVEAQFVGQGGVEVTGLLGHLVLRLLVGCVAYLAHQADAIGDHDEHHAHVLGEGEEQVAEVLALHNGSLAVELLDADEPLEDRRHALAEVLARQRRVIVAAKHALVEHDGQQTVTAQADVADGHLRRHQSLEDGIEAEAVALDVASLDLRMDMGAQTLHVSTAQGVVEHLVNLLSKCLAGVLFFLGENEFFFHWLTLL